MNKAIDPHIVFKKMMVNEKLHKHFPEDFHHLVSGFYKIFPLPAERRTATLEGEEKEVLHKFCNLYKKSEEADYEKLTQVISDNKEMKKYLKKKGFFPETEKQIWSSFKKFVKRKP
ncbi:hypothetical protein H0N96_01855 [Candidatus Micrarchaeota archaeon]|nr:hypothetical protein [Candidatus Micrarchaeota archaeon]